MMRKILTGEEKKSLQYGKAHLFDFRVQVAEESLKNWSDELLEEEIYFNKQKMRLGRAAVEIVLGEAREAEMSSSGTEIYAACLHDFINQDPANASDALALLQKLHTRFDDWYNGDLLDLMTMEEYEEYMLEDA